MIISYKHKFIFIHCRKVAGSSIKVDLAPYLGDEDIIIGSLHEILQAGYRLPKRVKRDLFSLKGTGIFLAYLATGRSPSRAVSGLKWMYRNKLGSKPAHPSAETIRKAFPYEWDNFTKFAFVRNPFDRLASDYTWRMRLARKHIPFRNFLEDIVYNRNETGMMHSGRVSNWEMISVNDMLAVDKIGYYENLEYDFSKILCSIGIPNAQLVSKAKDRQSRKTYENMYGPHEIDLVRIGFARELSTFGYEYPF